MYRATTAPIGEFFRKPLGEIDEQWFASIAKNKLGWDKHIADHYDLGLSFLRYPGGTIAERALVVDGESSFSGTEVSFDMLSGNRDNIAYDITHPELMSPLVLAADDADPTRNEVGSFSEALDFAAQNNTDLGVILPIFRYFNGVDYTDPAQAAAGKAQIIADVNLFLDRLEAGDFNGGIYPEKILLEIGNEAYANPIEYALIAKTMVETIADRRDEIGVTLDVAVQMSVGSLNFASLDDAGYFDTYFNANGGAKIAELSGFNFTGADGLSYEERITVVDEMMTKIMGSSLADIDTIRHHTLGLDYESINYGPLLATRSLIVDHWEDEIHRYTGAGKDIEYYVSAWTVDSGNHKNEVYGTAAGANIISALSYFVGNNVSRAAVWGVAAADNYFPEVGSGRTLTVADSDVSSPAAEVLRLVTESLPGAQLLDTGQELSFSDATRNDYQMSVFETADEMIIFLSAGDLDGGKLTIDVDLSKFGAINTVEVTHVETFTRESAGPAWTTQEQVNVVNGKASVLFDTDFETVRVVVDKPASMRDAPLDITGFSTDDLAALTANAKVLSAGDDVLIGRASSGVVFGMEGDDLLQGGGGRGQTINADFWAPARQADAADVHDVLFGGEGNDILLGKFGNDWLSGGTGNDIMTGGGGMDTFVFDSGRDVITDFRHQTDQIAIDASLVSVLAEPTDIVSEYGRISGGSAIFDFGSGDRLVITGYDSLDPLRDVFDFF